MVARYAIAHSRSDIESGILDGAIFAGLDGVLHIAHHIESAVLGKFGVAFNVKATLLRTRRGIGEPIGGAGDHFHLYSFAVLHMHGGATIDGCGIGEIKPVELDSGFVGTRGVEFAVGRRA